MGTDYFVSSLRSCANPRGQDDRFELIQFEGTSLKLALAVVAISARTSCDKRILKVGDFAERTIQLQLKFQKIFYYLKRISFHYFREWLFFYR